MRDSRLPLILVVDDDLDTRDLYRIVFESSGYRVADAADVTGAMRTAEATPPEVVVTDWILQDARGIDILENMRARPALRHVPSIIVTGAPLDASTVSRARTAGCERILLKPVDLGVMTDAAAEALSTRRSRELRRAARRVWWHAARERRQSSGNARNSGDVRTAAIELLSRVRGRSDRGFAIVLADDRARYVAASGEATALTGYPHDDLMQLTVWDLTPLPAMADGQELWNAFIARGSQEGKYALLRRDGAVVEAQYYALANVLPGLHLSAISPR